MKDIGTDRNKNGRLPEIEICENYCERGNGFKIKRMDSDWA